MRKGNSMTKPRIALKRGATGDKAKSLQKGINDIVKGWRFPWLHTKIDGVAGSGTFRSAHWAAWFIGLSKDQLDLIADGMISEHAFEMLTRVGPRTEEMRDRTRDRSGKIARFRKDHNHPDTDGLGKFEGVTVAGWMVQWLEKSRSKGWDGSVTSGYRDPDYSEQLCYRMCGAPSCSGTCAGRNSNHSGKDYPAGAIDVTDYDNFARIQKEIGSPLKNELDARDPVHFSVSGH